MTAPASAEPPADTADAPGRKPQRACSCAWVARYRYEPPGEAWPRRRGTVARPVAIPEGTASRTQHPRLGSGGDRRALDQACGNLVAEDRVRDHHGIKVGADLDDLVAVEAADAAVMVRELRAFVSRGDGVKFGDCGVSINEQAFDLEPDSPRTLAVCRVPGA